MYYVMYKDGQGYWRWSLKAANHETISVSSESYVSKQSCEYSIRLNKSSGNAPVYES